MIILMMNCFCKIVDQQQHDEPFFHLQAVTKVLVIGNF